MLTGSLRSWLCLLVLFVALLSARYSMASPVEAFIPGFAIAIQHETVNDTVEYSPNLQEGGFASAVEKPRFQLHGIVLSYNASRQTQFQFGFSQRQLNSLRDAFSVNEISAGVNRRFQSPASARYSLNIGADARINMASEIYKNSYTSYADNLITEVRVVEPRDARLSAHADLSVALTERLHLTFAISGGLSRTSQQEVLGIALLDNDCPYAFNASVDGGSVNQLERCGDLVSYEQRYPDSQSLNDNLGFSVEDDLTYRDYFFGRQISLHWQAASWSMGTGYEFREYFRPTLDHRIREAGNTPVTRSHTAYANASVDVFKNWQLAALVRYQRAAFLDDIPFLYNALTNERYRGDGVIRYGLSISRFFN